MNEVALTQEMERANLRKFASQQTGFPALLKFKKGEYFLGTGNEPVALGTKYIAHATSVANGWIKFVGGTVVDRKIGRAKDGFVLPERGELDSKDFHEWAAGPDGKPADPWVQQTYLPFESLDGKAVVSFATSSTGGVMAIQKLVDVYCNEGKAGELPVIELATSSFVSKKFGKIITPYFKVVDWHGSTGTTILPPEPKSPAAGIHEMDEDIPF